MLCLYTVSFIQCTQATEAPAALVDKVKQKSEGNPLWAIEFAHSLIESEVIEVVDGVTVLKEDLENIE